jgi:hypothetical protein
MAISGSRRSGEVEDTPNTPRPWWKGMEWIEKKTNLHHGGNQIATIRGKATRTTVVGDGWDGIKA